MNTININIRDNLTQDEQHLFALLNEVARQNKCVVRACGGWVRDRLLGVKSDDIDIMVDNMSGEEFANKVSLHVGASSPHVIRANPEKSKNIETAKSYIPLPSGKVQEVDFARARKEEYTGNSRIPTIQNASPEEDAIRRDLTINALFYNLSTMQVEDFTGKGIRDLVTNTFRTPKNPLQTFLEDPLRILRVIRFAAKYNGEIDKETFDAMHNPELKNAIRAKISKERIGTEIRKILKNPNPNKAISLLKSTGLLQDLLDDALKGTKYEGKMKQLDMSQNNPHHELSLWEHTLQVFINALDIYKDAEEEKRIIMALSTICHDLGKLFVDAQEHKPNNGKYPNHNNTHYTSYPGHEDESAIIAEHLLRHLKLDQYIDQVSKISKFHMRPHSLERDNASDKAMRQFIRTMAENQLHWLDVFNIALADACSKNKNVPPEVVERYNKLKDNLERAMNSMTSTTGASQKPLLNGNEIMQALNIPAGKHLKQIVDFLKDLQDSDPNTTKEQALEAIKLKFSNESLNFKKASLVKSSSCPKHLYDQCSETILKELNLNKGHAAFVLLEDLISKYPDDEAIARFAAIALFKGLCKNSGNNIKISQFVIDKAKCSLSDPILNSYAYGIIKKTSATINEQDLEEIKERACILSQGTFDKIIELLKHA